MTTRTQTSPFSRLSLVGKSAQSSSRARDSSRQTNTDDDYIPYTGPYEEPPPRRQGRSRDSWGDPLYDEDGNNMIQELHQRYVPPTPTEYPWREEDEDRKGRPRARTHSGVSGRTVSSGTVDPHRASVSVMRKGSQHAHAARPPVPSYINLDAAGGVGETPVPPSRFSREIASPKRTSLGFANIFNFGQASKKAPLSPARVALPTSPSATSPLVHTKYARVFATEPPKPVSGPPSVYSDFSDKHQPSFSSQEDVYHSYYNYTPAADQFGPTPSIHRATPPPHPYAYTFPRGDIPEPPQTAPLVTSPKLKFTQPPHRLALPQQEVTAVPPHVRTLKTYVSTPDLRDASTSTNRLRKPPPKGKDRWLSAETWCDAVMFPRPRLKVEDAQLIMRGASGRIVSPPGSPIVGGFDAPQNPDRPAGMVSRVLAHSRSMVSLNAVGGTNKLKPEVTFKGWTPEPLRLASPPPPVISRPQGLARPKSFAWDDLALPSPVPSLARVLEEGQILEHQRRKWQMQAAGSFQNTRARSLSRARAKSLTQRGGQTGQSNMDFLAARSLLGNQNLVPVVPVRTHSRTASRSATTNTIGTTSFNTRTSRTSHSHSNSLVKTTSKSSHGHSRQESWSRSALNKAAALCYPDGFISPVDERANGLETALRTGGTKVIRLADPALDTNSQLNVSSPRNGASPTPSTTSDAFMGIAVGTPPADGSSLEHESIHLPSHPYAKGGTVTYPYQPVAPAATKGADYAGPHPAVVVLNPNPQDFSARHRLPPQPSIAHHPYASPSSRRDSYQIVPRADSDVPPASKMWAQLSPGVVREILPGELLYSPFMSEHSQTLEEQQREPVAYGQNRKSTVSILDTVGLGEALVSAVEEEHNRDSGLGTSEDHAPNTEEWVDDGQAAAAEAHHPYRIHRKPVLYDISRPLYTPKKSGVSSNNTNHTLASSPVDSSVSHAHRLSPQTPSLPSGGSPGLNSQHSNASSPPRSPPPIGSVDDLDDFHDLFYKPNLTDEVLNNLSRPASTRYPSVTWDLASTTRTQRTRTGSGLTSLAQQLSMEFEDMRAGRHLRARTDSMGSESSISRFSAFPTENDIRFVFSDSEMSRSIREEPSEPIALPAEAMSAFRASGRIPEDVESSRASSLDAPVGDEEEDELEIRLGNVESVSTPPATSTDYRNSYMGQMTFAEEHGQPPPKGALPLPRVVSSLQPHSADPTRSSYMTESTLSRMSNLSDFPSPPPQQMTPAHMSLLSSYFHEAVAERVVPETEPPPFTPRIGERF
ncbi:hypothetical protein B0H15DRAFT_904537 [Mycena belliarum]|uniref:Uncharacterized protein n=1 Tax=Mycena belliarum TaxID=1033014 RepID=A0AAD6UDH5_9AGAR|nr:hypothetical protein B0H15DRAFT_904537 [Mycena belliae]